jgi:PAS domain-containing protein
MTWPPNPYVVALWIIAASLVALAAVAWGKRRYTRGARSFTFFTLAGAVWALAEGMEAGVVDPAAQAGLAAAQVPGHRHAAGRAARVRERLHAPDRVAQPLRRHAAAGAARHHGRLGMDLPAPGRAVAFGGHGRRALVAVRGPWFWVHTASSYLWLAIGSFYLLRGYVGTPRGYRAQLTWVLVAVAMPWVANLVFVFTDLDVPIDPTPLTFAVSAWAFAQSLLSHRLLDIVPVARETVMRHLGDPVLVLDPRQRVLQANPAAAALFGVERPTTRSAAPRPICSTTSPTLVRALGGDAFVEHDLTWSRTDPERYLRAQITPLATAAGATPATWCGFRTSAGRCSPNARCARASAGAPSRRPT